MPKLRWLSRLGALLFILAACVPNPIIAVTSTPVFPVFTPDQAAVQPTAVRIIQPIATPTSTPYPAGFCPPADKPTTQHVVVADVDYAARTASVQQRIHYTNTTSEPLAQIVLNVEANRAPESFHLRRIVSDKTELASTLSGKRLVIELPDMLNPDCEIHLTLDYALVIPHVISGSYAAKGYYSYTERQLNLGHWLAAVAVRQNGEWISHDPSLIGEQEVLEQADWNVTVNLTGAAQNITVAAPGDAQQITPSSWRFTLLHARDFTLSLSDQFSVNSQPAESGVIVELYNLDNPTAPGAAIHALNVGRRSLQLYEELFGTYPYGRMVIVQGDFPDGMEFHGLVFVGDSWFSRFPNDPASYLTLITAHEVSHQWWYAQVGNDAAIHPWLDEALATYSEYLFLEREYPDLAAWWWSFRVDAYGPTGFVDGTVYQFSSAREYINAVYLRGVRMLHAIREDLGDEAFFALLRAYADSGNGHIATPETFWSLLTPEQLALTEETRQLYLRQPQVVGGR